jgi:alkanesulfonate monooxygenase SsuD/methylene tetrahydromethanopterin reductase-like flavin-dependent oxidoreductase (luciferase family)
MNYPIQFGFCVPIFAAPGNYFFRTPNYPALDVPTTMRVSLLADELGYDSLWVADHLMLGKDDAIMEGWTTLATLAGSTKHAKLGIIHQAHFFRNPALSAKMIATLDQISGGRFIYFIDGGTRASEHLAYGLPHPYTFEERLAVMLEGLELTLQLWQSETPVNFHARHYHAVDAVCTPRPVQKPHPPIWFGEAHPETLKAAARHAQGWNTVPVPMKELERRLEALKSACQEAGRPYDQIEKTLEIQILIAKSRDGLRERFREMLSHTNSEAPESLRPFLSGATDTLPAEIADSWIIGTPDEVSAQVQRYLDMSFTHFMLWFVDMPREDGLRLFAEQVAPRFKPSAASG